ncbi:MAG TPA: tetratricopeptide repeat-containing diguanylate cyclase [Caldimonas sp.]|jgi:diguanylate cyclase (GGDEF)-like protein|nr:tetratricopeptide repeat-containing diguanylate cyclase [Caldimonas sp.]HEX2542667.1 tetratricopeptide repeat-containing diguanylate cyclase [Caldimonas sp.]
MSAAALSDPLDAARAALQAGDVQAARSLLESCLADPGVTATVAHAELAVELGDVHEQAGDYAEAMARFVQGHDIALRHDHPTLKARALRGMARVDHAMGDLQHALGRLNEAVALVALHGDARLEGELLHQLGMTHSRLGNFAAAESCFLRALLCRRESGDDRAGVAATLNSLGVLHLTRGNASAEAGSGGHDDLERARSYFGQALGAAREGGDRQLEARALGNLGTVAGSLGQLPLALDLFGRELAVLRAMNDRRYMARALTHLAAAQRRSGSREAALASLLEALEIAAEVDAAPQARGAHAELSLVREELGDFQSALLHFKAYHRLDQQIRSAQAERRATLVNARYAVDQIRREAEAYRAERDRLRDANQVLAAQALTDALTGLGNRRSFDRAIARVLHRGPFEGALAAMDVDRFKQVNDEFSHLTGDEVLRRIGVLVETAMRPGDQAFRVGGEEFLILLPGISADVAVGICERIRRAIEEHPWEDVAPALRVTASFGVAAAQPRDGGTSLIGRADAALYAAKKAGRNQVVGTGLAALPDGSPARAAPT